MDDTPLQTALGIYRLDGLHHAAESIGAKQINIHNTPTFEVIQHIQPEFAALMLTDPHAENVFSAIHGDVKNYIMFTDQSKKYYATRHYRRSMLT